MLKIRTFIVVFALFCFQSLFSQTVEIFGRVKSDGNIENIHVINKTANFFTITGRNGEFKIEVNLNDTLQFSSIQHKVKRVVISNDVIFTKALLVLLDVQINELDEVVIGKVLTGNLFLDINNTTGDPPINFYDVGIPGYTGRIKTQSERRLSQASDFSPKAGGSLGGVGGSISAIAIINAISGRTKTLKNRVNIEKKEVLMQRIIGRLSKDFFASNSLEEDLRMDFFYFCADDANFIKYCKNQNDFKILLFLRHKYEQYIQNINTQDD